SELPLSAAATLQALAGTYVFFTHALFFTHGGLDPQTQDPVLDFLNHAPTPPTVTWVDFSQRPLFRGLAMRPEQRVWEHRLLAVPQPEWPALQRHLAGVSAIDRTQRQFWLSQMQL